MKPKYFLWKWLAALGAIGILGFLILALLREVSRTSPENGFIPYLEILFSILWISSARFIYQNFSSAPFPVTSIWVLGFYALIGFNMVVEAFVLPAYGWDNTPKNDWYFQLWWVVVLVWTFLGGRWIRYKLGS